MGIFSGINTVAMGGSRPENFRAGRYNVTVAAAKAFVTRKDKDAVVIEFRISDAESLPEQPEGIKPNRVNSRVRAFYSLSRKRSGELDEDGERWMERLKTLLANILGGDERVVDGDLQPVTDEDITPLIAASIIKGTEYKVNDIDEAKMEDLTMTIATKPEADGGLGMDEETATAVIEEGQLMLADVRGLSLRVVAKPNGKGNFVNLYWAPAE